MMDETKDYEVTVKVRNGRIKAAMRKAGYATVAELSRNMGLCKDYCSLIGIINMKVSPRDTRTGEWKPIIYDLSSALHCEPEDLFTARQMAGFTKTSFTVELSEAAAVAIGGPTPEDVVFRHELEKMALDSLRPRESTALIQRFGLDGQGERKLKEVEIKGAYGSVSAERVRQIERRAVRRMAYQLKAGGLNGH